MADNLISAGAATDHIYEHSGLSAVLTGSFVVNDNTFPNPTGITIESTGSLVSADSTADHIYQHSGISEVLVGSFASPGAQVQALVIDSSDNLISADIDNGFVYTHNGITSTITGSFSPFGGAFTVNGIALDSSNNLITTNQSSNFIFIHDGISSTLTGSFAQPADGNSHIVVDNDGNLIFTQINVDHIYLHDGISATLTGSFSTPDGVTRGLATISKGPTIFTVSVSDTLSITDTFTRGVWTLSRSFTDTLSISDSIAVFPTRTRKIIRDTLSFIKTDLLNNITDPDTSNRPSNSRFIMSSYPSRAVHYPLVTIIVTNINVIRTGSQSNVQEVLLTLEIRVWARNEREKDEIYTDILNRLNDIQLTNTGTAANNLHDFTILSSVEVDEPGESGGQVTKSRILNCQYLFYNIL